MRRQVAELDFRLPEFRDAKVEDYEFREDGKLVRKDRWESAVREIKSLVLGGTREFEIDDVVAAVRDLVIKRINNDMRDPGNVYFASHEAAENAIKVIGEDRLMSLLLED